MRSLYNKYRPKKLSEVVGQHGVVSVIQGWLENQNTPPAIILTGPSGTGKTTVARILARKLGCSPKLDVIEQNCADLRGVDDIRSLQRRTRPHSVGASRLTILDEAHQLTTASQNCLLKVLEDAPEWCYYVLCTTDPHKIIKTVQNRCSLLKFDPVDEEELKKLISHVSRTEGFKVRGDIVNRIVDVADGSPRSALVILDTIRNLPSQKEQERAIEKADPRRESIEIARALINPRARWDDVAKLLKSCDLSEPESLRHLILNYAGSVLLGSNYAMALRAARIISIFRDNLFDSKRAGFLLYCFQVVSANQKPKR